MTRKFTVTKDTWLKIDTTEQSIDIPRYKKIFVEEGTVLYVDDTIHSVPNKHLECKLVVNIFGDHLQEENDHKGNMYKFLEEVFPKGNPNKYNDLIATLDRFEINTPNRILHFLSQIGHESAGLYYTREIASGAAYEGRRDLGNTQPGDGKRFKGAGYLMSTGRVNYQKFADYIDDPDVMVGVDYVSKRYPGLASGFWWHNNRMNQLCDQGATVKEITRRVNGGYNGLADRWSWYNRIVKLWQTLM